MKTLLKCLGIGVGVVIAALFGLYYAVFGGLQGVNAGPALVASIERVNDGMMATIFVVDLGDGKVALVDAGNDASGAPILEALKKRGKTAEDVAAIFITHAHPDHTAAVGLFPRATVYAGRGEVELSAGHEAYRNPISKLMPDHIPHPFKVSRPLDDGETVNLGNKAITAYAMPGHTPGSTAYLIDGALFLGDAANIRSGGKLAGPIWAFSNDGDEGKRSLAKLATKTAGRPVGMLVTAHTGAVAGRESLDALAMSAQ